MTEAEYNGWYGFFSGALCATAIVLVAVLMLL